MANFKSTTATAQEAAAANAGSIISDSALISGKIRVLQCDLTVPAGTGASDTIEIGYLPAGATVIPGLCTITGPAAGAGTVGVGVTGSATAIAAAVSMNTAGTKLLAAGLVGSYKTTARVAVVLTLSGALTAAGVHYINIPYTSGE